MNSKITSEAATTLEQIIGGPQPLMVAVAVAEKISELAESYEARGVPAKLVLAGIALYLCGIKHEVPKFAATINAVIAWRGDGTPEASGAS